MTLNEWLLRITGSFELASVALGYFVLGVCEGAVRS